MEQYFTVEPSANGKYHNVVFHAARAFADGATDEYFTALGTSAQQIRMSVEPAGNGTYVIDDAAMTTHPDFDSAVAAAKAALVNRT